MAQTIGSAFAETFGTGQRMGDAWSERRFRAKAQAIRTEFEALAAQEGKNLEDYLPQMETALRSAAESSQRRGLSLEQPVLDQWNSDIGRASERRAGALALQGNQAGARDVRAGAQYALGNFDEGQGQQIAGDTIRATSAAMQRDPSTGQMAYNPAAGAAGISRVGAQYGNADAAAQGQQQAGSFRLQAAQGLAGQLFNLFQSPEVANPDQVVGLYEGLKQYVPELGNTELRVGEDGSWNIYANGSKTATGSFNPNDRNDMDEFSSLLTNFSQKPIDTLNTYQQTRIQNIAARRKSDEEFSGKIDDARIKVVTDAKSQGIPESVATSLFKASTGTGESKGWQLQEIGDTPGSYLVQKNGKVYRIETNVEPNLETGQPGGKVQVFTADGKPVPASELNAPEQDGLEFTMRAISDLSSINNASQLEWMRGQLGALQSLYNQRFNIPEGGAGGGGTRGERNNNPGNIEDRGQFRGNPDYLGSDGRFARFRTPEAGRAAMQAQLERYMEGRTTGTPLTTVADIVGTWSPQTDPTNQAGSTANYVRYVARTLGVDPNAPLSRQDIPRLMDAMAQFESGNTGALPTSRGNVVAGASDAPPAQPTRAIAQSAPTAQRPVAASRRALSPEGVRRTAGELREARAAVDTAKANLERFDREISANAPKMRRAIPGRLEGFRTEEVPELTNAQRAVRERLAAELSAAEERRDSLRGAAQRGAAALNQQTRQTKQQAEEQELYSRYGGAADFFRAAQ